MGIVTIGTNHLTFTDGVVRNFLAVRTLVFVAGKADFWLRLLVANVVGRSVNFVAVVARHAVVLMLATIPVVARAALVTGKTLVCAHFVIGDRKCTFLEDNIRCSTAFTALVSLQVIFTCAVTRLARGGVRISPDTVLGLVD